jgi:hypothetical protein
VLNITNDPDAAAMLNAVIQAPQSLDLRRRLASHYKDAGFITAAALFEGSAVLLHDASWKPAAVPLQNPRWDCIENSESSAVTREAATVDSRDGVRAAIKRLRAAQMTMPTSCIVPATLAYLELRETLWKPTAQSPADRERIIRTLVTIAGETETIPSPTTSHAEVFVAVAQLFEVNGDRASELAAFRLARQQADLRKGTEFLGGTEMLIQRHEH